MNEKLMTLVVRPQSLNADSFIKDLNKSVVKVEQTHVRCNIILAQDNGTHSYPVLADIYYQENGEIGMWFNEPVLVASGLGNIKEITLKRRLRMLINNFARGITATQEGLAENIEKLFKEYYAPYKR